MKDHMQWSPLVFQTISDDRGKPFTNTRVLPLDEDVPATWSSVKDAPDISRRTPFSVVANSGMLFLLFIICQISLASWKLAWRYLLVLPWCFIEEPHGFILLVGI